MSRSCQVKNLLQVVLFAWLALFTASYAIGANAEHDQYALSLKQPEASQHSDKNIANEDQDESAPMRVSTLEIPSHFSRLCRRFALLLESRHYVQKPLDKELSQQAWTNYIMMLDYDRCYFLQSDIEAFEQWRFRLCDDLRAGNLEFPVKVFEVFRERLANRYSFVEEFLKQEQDYSIKEEYQWERKEAPWAANETEWDDLWRRKMKNELLGRIVSRDYAISNDLEKAVSPTNSVAAASSASPVTNSVAATTNPPPPVIDMSPESVVGRRYKQYKGIIQDADADYILERFLCSFSQVYDPHSTYMPPTRVDDFNIDMNLTLCGIGATLQSEDGMAKVVSIMPGGPAGRDTREIRLRDNDKIYAVGQDDGPVEDIVHLPLDKIVKRIRGKKGTRVVLHVISASDPSGNTTKVVDLIRDDIKLEESAATGRVVRVSMAKTLPLSPIGEDGKHSLTSVVERAFGYVNLPMFYGSMTSPNDPNFRSCTWDVAKIISGFNDEVEGLVLDLRGNGGGSLREAVALAGSFIRLGPIVIVREGARAQPLSDTDPAIVFRKPLIVMIDKASASASEIVAAALQDCGRALIVGDSKSHGKGSVQNVMPLIATDESYGSLKLTIASFYRINGSSTQIKGVSSDIVLPSTMEYMDIGEDKLPSAMAWTSIPPMNYKIVYPLGGIIPSLRKKSMERLANNAEWAKHIEEVEHIRKVGERKSVPLDYARRYQLLSEDSKVGIDSESDEADKQDRKVADDGIGDDIVLRETFNILGDLVDAQGGSGITTSQDADVSDWIYKFFN